jgi:hypothetical protein
VVDTEYSDRCCFFERFFVEFGRYGWFFVYYIMESGGKWMLTCVSSNLVLYGMSFIVHSSSGMVRIVIVF